MPTAHSHNESSQTNQYTQTELATHRHTQTMPLHTYHNINTSNAAVQSALPSGKAAQLNPKPDFSEDEMQDWVNTLTAESVARAIDAAESVGYQQMEIQLIAEKLAIENEAVPIVHVPNDNRPYVRVNVNENGVCN